MCGIAGIYRTDQAPVEPAALAAMTASLAHRGPDGQGLWHDGPIGFGHRRLAIRDLSDGGRQPMWTPGGEVFSVFNGEIYNDGALRRALEREIGARFQSTCDAEVVPFGWLAWGDRLFDRLEGMFAIAVWDARSRTLALARDGAGIKPLFFSDAAGAVRFGSEAKALLTDPAQPRDIDPASLHAFMAQGYVAPDASLHRDIRQVPPGTVVCFDGDGERRRTFWRPRRAPEIRDPREAVDGFLSVWETVVGDVLTSSDVPVGVLQSGGIDSSLITLSIAERAGTPLFVAQFAEASHDESSLAAQVAESVGLPLNRVPIRTEGEEEDVFRRTVRAFDGQVADSSAYAVYPLMAAVRRHAKVVLSGDGGDEFFGGYPTYRASRVARMLSPLTARGPARFVGRKLLGLTGQDDSRMPALEIAGRFLLGLAEAERAPHAHWRRLLPGFAAPGLYGPALKAVAHGNPLGRYEAAVADAEGDLLDRCLAADQGFYLPADMLMKVDAMSMAHGLEVRVPFLDRRIMDFAGRLDGRVLNPFLGPHKKVLRQAAQRMGAPAEVVAGGKKGFNVPITRVLRGPLARLGSHHLDETADRLAPYFVPADVRRLWRSHLARRTNHGYVLWTLLSVAVWLDLLEATPFTDDRSLDPAPGTLAGPPVGRDSSLQ